jgi:NADPH:quinone reductase-like Zn-dependent oxidoreductase
MNRCVGISEKGGLVDLNLIEREEQVPSMGEIKVKWHATSLNYHDYLVAKGVIPVEEGRIPMSDGAGQIVEIGAGVSNWKVGDRVMSLFFPNWIHGIPDARKTRSISGETVDGYACDYSCLRYDQVTRIPSGFTFAEAATLPCAALTSWRALMVEGKIKAGDTVLAEGSGGMSIFAIQMAKMAGAKVYATTGSPDKAERLMDLGAEAVINYKEDPHWGKTVYKMSGGIDHVLDVGGQATMRQSIEAVKVYGNIYSIGILGGPKGEILFPKLFFKHIHLIGLAVGSAEMQEDMVKAIEANGLKPVIDKTFALSVLTEAFKYQEKGLHFGKIVVEW